MTSHVISTNLHLLWPGEALERRGVEELHPQQRPHPAGAQQGPAEAGAHGGGLEALGTGARRGSGAGEEGAEKELVEIN